MSYAGLEKRLQVPDGFVAPDALAFEGLRARPLTRDELEDDVAGINGSLELILRTRGGGWPTEPVTPEGNYVDLVWHECEAREGYSYGYVVRDADGTYLGCWYLYPVGRRVELTADLLHHDVDVSWWVTQAAYDAGHYATLHRAALHWAVTDFPFRAPYVSNAEVPGR